MHATFLTVAVLFYSFHFGLCQIVDDFKYECRLKSSPSPVVTGTAPHSVGRPGKRGAVGLKGQKGESGEQGTISKVQIEEAVKDQMQKSRPSECPIYGTSGIMRIYPEPFTRDGIKVYCDTTVDGGKWIVLQRREDGSGDFYRTWKEYSNGFGSFNGEYWIGLETMHRLTTTHDYELRIDMEDFDGNYAWVKYTTFKIGNAESKYTLTVNGYSGTAGNSLSYHSGKMFSTKDSDNDTHSTDCAERYIGAWWYGSCHHSNLNGKYLEGGERDPKGVDWRQWKNGHYSLKFVEMKMRKITE